MYNSVSRNENEIMTVEHLVNKSKNETSKEKFLEFSVTIYILIYEAGKNNLGYQMEDIKYCYSIRLKTLFLLSKV